MPGPFDPTRPYVLTPPVLTPEQQLALEEDRLRRTGGIVVPVPTPVTPGAPPPGPTPEQLDELRARMGVRPVGTVAPGEVRVDLTQPPPVTEEPPAVPPQRRPAPAVPVAPPAPVARGGGGEAGILREQTQAAKQMGEAIKAQAAAAMQQADAVAQVQQRQAENQQKLAAQRADYEGRARTALQERAKKVEQATDAFLNVSTEVNPRRFWADRTTGQKFLGVIGTFLGGLGGGPNRAMEHLQRTVDQDIELQREQVRLNLEKGRQGVEGSMNMFGLYRQMLGDEAAAMAATEATMLAQFKSDLEATLAKYQSPELKAKGEVALAALGQGLAEKRAALLMNLKELSLKEAELGIREAAASAKSAKPDGTYVPGIGVARSKEAANDVAEAASAHADVVGIIDRLEAHRKKWGPEVVSRDAVAEGQSMAADLMTALLRAKKLGSLDKGSQEVLDALSGGDPAKFAAYLPRLRALRQGQENRYRAYLRYNIVEPEAEAKAATINARPR